MRIVTLLLLICCAGTYAGWRVLDAGPGGPNVANQQPVPDWLATVLN